MKAWLLDRQDGIGGLRIGEVAEPKAGPVEVVLQVEFAGLNPADRYLAENQYPARPKFPHILGRDAVGRVISIGTDVHDVDVGDQVAILRGDVGVNLPGTFAERVAVPADSLIKVPDRWSPEETAGAPLVYLTAWQALTQWGEGAPGVTLITGASGGVGVASVQLAKALGHTVVALSRDSGKRDELVSLGADAAIDPSDASWPKTVRGMLGGRRVDLAVDSIGGALFPQIIESMGESGRISVVGRLAGPVPQFNTASLFFRRLRIGGVAVGAYGAAEGQSAWREIVKAMSLRAARPKVDSVFPFEQLPSAFERLHAGPMGKVLLRVPA